MASERSSPSATSPTPTMARRAASTLPPSGRRRVTTQLMNGVITQYVAVRKALRPGVVSSRPMFCTTNAAPDARPRIAPMARWLTSRLSRRVRQKSAPTMTADAAKRMPMSHAGGMASSVSFMTTKEPPQMAAHAARESFQAHMGTVLPPAAPAMFFSALMERNYSVATRFSAHVLP